MATNVRFLARSAPVKSSLKRDLIAAVAAGQAAGLIMAVMIVAVAGRDLPPILSSAFVIGLAIHQFIALLWSLLFGFLINRVLQTFGNVLAVGLAIGVLSQLFQSPALVPTWAQSLPLGWSWAVHLVFGLAFLIFVPIRSRLPAS